MDCNDFWQSTRRRRERSSGLSLVLPHVKTGRLATVAHERPIAEILGTQDASSKYRLMTPQPLTLKEAWLAYDDCIVKLLLVVGQITATGSTTFALRQNSRV
jgi:hypothetical protein